MKVVFKKDKEQQINVFLEDKGKQYVFSYTDMIKELIEAKKLDEPVISEGFTDAEIKSIKSMVTLINKSISNRKDKK